MTTLFQGFKVLYLSLFLKKILGRPDTPSSNISPLQGGSRPKFSKIFELENFFKKGGAKKKNFRQKMPIE